VAVLVAVSFLQQIPVESPAEEEALESGCLRGAELTQAGRAPLPQFAAAEAVTPPEQLRGAGTLQQQSRGVLTQHQSPSINTIAGVAGK
jgi:hypothetical protein